MMERDYTTVLKAFNNNEPGDVYEVLAQAIVITAADEYLDCIKKLLAKDRKNAKSLYIRKREIEGFFCSEWYAMLTDIPGYIMMARCRKEAIEAVKKEIIRRIDDDFKKRLKGY